MEIYFQIVTDADGVARACEELAGDEYLGFDTETTELDPYDGSLRLIQFSNGKSTFVIDVKPFMDRGDIRSMPDLEPLRALLAAPKPIKIAHNAKFDAKWICHHLGVDLGGVFDTMLASQLIAAGDTDRRHNLAEVANFFLGVELDKSQQVSDWSAAELSQEQVQYAAKDAAIMVGLREKIVERLRQDDLIRVAKLEFDTVVPLAQMELNGFFIDQERWREQLSKMLAEQKRIAAELQGMLAAGVAQASLFGTAEINLDSQSQVADALRNLGVPLTHSTRHSQLEPLADDYPVVAKLIEYRGVAKAISSFGENILEYVRPETGRLHSDFRQIGAPTGRFSSSNPNIQQIPHDEAYRRCFRAPEGRKLVVADYSQIELRILAEFSKDENLLKAFQSDADFHSMAAAQVFGIDPDAVTPDQRSFAKRLNFGVVYGMGASRFATMTGLSQEQAEGTLRRYFQTYRGLDSWLRESGNSAVANRVSRTGSGRMYRHKFDDNDREKIGNVKRNAKNFPIQGTSADILKRSLCLLHAKIAGSRTKLVNIVHDEIILECDAADAENVRDLLIGAMTDAAREYLKTVPIKVDAKIGDDWAK